MDGLVILLVVNNIMLSQFSLAGIGAGTEVGNINVQLILGNMTLNKQRHVLQLNICVYNKLPSLYCIVCV